MSDLEALQKATKENINAISALLQAEKNGERIKQEIASLQRKLEGLYANIRTAESDLEKTKAESLRLQADTAKNVNDTLSKAAAKDAESDKRLVEAKRLERNAQGKFGEAQELVQKYNSQISELNAKKERILAAIA